MKIEYIATLFFTLALMHTFLVSIFARIGQRFSKGGVGEAFFHLLSEVEVVFGFWAFLFLITWALFDGVAPVIAYQQSLRLTEPLFIFCVMIIASSRPVISISRGTILFICGQIKKIWPIDYLLLQLFTLLTVGPLLGSLITEPAAITITALLLYRMIEKDKIDSSLLYSIVAVLFVNISVGGALTHFAAPPILIVATTWGWTLSDVYSHLGGAAIFTVVINSALLIIMNKPKARQMLKLIEVDNYPMPVWVVLSHLLFLGAIVATAHHSQVFFGLFLIFVGLVSVTKLYQDELKFKESLMVAFFLSGLIVFGEFQRWWIEPLVLSMNESGLFFGAAALTSVTDNAALTYLGSQVPSLSEVSKWALVGGALAGGGLTILANAPNPAGFTILSSKFPDQSLNAIRLLRAAVIPTLVALLCFYLILF